VNVQMFEVGARGGAVKHKLYGAGTEGGAALGGKHIIAGRMEILPPETAQGANLNPAQPMVAIEPILEPTEVQHALVEVEMVPSEPERLDEPEAMRKEHEEEGAITQSPSPFARCFDKPLNFFGGEMLALAWSAGRRGLRDFSLFASWWGFGHSEKDECF
jgi:hypothetical protein